MRSRGSLQARSWRAHHDLLTSSSQSPCNLLAGEILASCRKGAATSYFSIARYKADGTMARAEGAVEGTAEGTAEGMSAA